MSRTRIRGSNELIGSWNTIWSRSRRNLSRRSGSGEMSVPSTTTRPDVGRSSPASSRSSVDLPQPDSPTIPKRSPALTSKLTPRRAWTVWPGRVRLVRGRW